MAQPKRLARALAAINESSVPITPFARRRIGDFTMVESTQIPGGVEFAGTDRVAAQTAEPDVFRVGGGWALVQGGSLTMLDPGESPAAVGNAQAAP